ncbi:MAG: hypothetical protein Q7K40_03035, partial [bacterium]|nr:hypothetical protein [bacterium]
MAIFYIAKCSVSNWNSGINIPYIIVYSPISATQAKIVVEFYSQKAIEPPQDRGGTGTLGGNQEHAQSTVWPWDIWVDSKYNKNDKIEPFIVRVKGQVVKDKYGNFSWDKKVVEPELQQPTVEVEFGKAVPEIDQSDIILNNLQANQSQGFIKDTINKIKQKAEGIVNQIKDFFAIFKPTAQISSFVGPATNSEGQTSSESEEGRPPQLPQEQELEDIAEQSQEIANQAEQVVSEPENSTTAYEDLLKIKAELEQAIKEKQAELDRLLALASVATSSVSTTTDTQKIKPSGGGSSGSGGNSKVVEPELQQQGATTTIEATSTSSASTTQQATSTGSVQATTTQQATTTEQATTTDSTDSSQASSTQATSTEEAITTSSTSSEQATSTEEATSTQTEDLLHGITNLMAVPSTVRGAIDLFWTCPT